MPGMRMALRQEPPLEICRERNCRVPANLLMTGALFTCGKPIRVASHRQPFESPPCGILLVAPRRRETSLRRQRPPLEPGAIQHKHGRASAGKYAGPRKLEGCGPC